MVFHGKLKEMQTEYRGQEVRIFRRQPFLPSSRGEPSLTIAQSSQRRFDKEKSMTRLKTVEWRKHNRVWGFTRRTEHKIGLLE